MLTIDLTGILTFSVPLAQTVGETSGPQWLSAQAKLCGGFVGSATCSLILIYFFVPETKVATTWEDEKRTVSYISLEELNQIFQVTIGDCIRYHVYVTGYYIARTLSQLHLRKEPDPIEHSMHYWAKVERPKAKQAEADNNSSEHTLSSPSDQERSDEREGARPDTGGSSLGAASGRNRSQGRRRSAAQESFRQSARAQPSNPDMIRPIPRVGDDMHFDSDGRLGF